VSGSPNLTANLFTAADAATLEIENHVDLIAAAMSDIMHCSPVAGSTALKSWLLTPI
jgi:hypothetical protein